MSYFHGPYNWSYIPGLVAVASLSGAAVAYWPHCFPVLFLALYTLGLSPSCCQMLLRRDRSSQDGADAPAEASPGLVGAGWPRVRGGLRAVCAGPAPCALLPWGSGPPPSQPWKPGGSSNGAAPSPRQLWFQGKFVDNLKIFYKHSGVGKKWGCALPNTFCPRLLN